MAPPPAAHAAGLRVLRTTRVAPAPPAGQPALPKRALPLIFMDVMWLRAQPVERVFFYRLGPDDDVDAVLSRMEESLPRAIHAFYPLAGRVRPTPGETNRRESDNGGSGRAAAAAHFIFSVDHRSRLVPRVPDKYLGNCVGPGFVSAPEEELAGAAVAGGVFTASAAVAAAIDEAVRGEPAYWEGWKERIVEACRDDAPFSVAGSTRFRVYDVDFGFGRPAKVEIVSVAKTGAVSAAEDRSGAGGIEVGIALLPERMDTFRRCLADAMAWFSSSSQCN
uniref:Uncharacterized protein n=1 Tax=Oryza rufipogon TaxID=4529 RepID=A0A0E0NF04_ORYRU